MYCPYCMTRLPDDGQETCPVCGKNMLVSNEAYQLPVGTLLAGRYYVGKVIGQGGFGITYVGCDTRLDLKVAIKEYYPRGMVNRISDYSHELTVTAGDQLNLYERQKMRFIAEARILAEFAGNPNVVRVSDILSENNTVYIVMEFLEGQTLEAYRRANGNLPFRSAVQGLFPVMDTLSEIHARGLIHRDISPSNIMITGRNQVKLLDFGAARDFESEENQSMSVILKPGYAPSEQYNRHGAQGPWSDVYALCATIYRLITGVIPENAIDRMSYDVVKYPSEMGVDVTPVEEAVLMCGMSVQAGKRFSSMSELKQAFETAMEGKLPEKASAFYRRQTASAGMEFDDERTVMAPSDERFGTPERTIHEEEKPARPAVWKKIIPIAAALAVIVVAGILIRSLLVKEVDKTFEVRGEGPAPALTEKELASAAQTSAEQSQETVTRSSAEETQSETAAEEVVEETTAETSAEEISAEETSAEDSYGEDPDEAELYELLDSIKGDALWSAETDLEEYGLGYELEYAFSREVNTGCVIDAEPMEGAALLTISMGSPEDWCVVYCEDPDGHIRWVNWRELNDAKQIVRLERHSLPDGALRFTRNYECDESYQRVLKESFDVNGELVSMTMYDYFQDGNIMDEYNMDPDYEAFSGTTYEYNSEGVPTAEYDFDIENDELSHTEIREVTETFGKTWTKANQLNADYELTGTIERFLDENGNILEEAYYDVDGALRYALKYIFASREDPDVFNEISKEAYEELLYAAE